MGKLAGAILLASALTFPVYGQATPEMAKAEEAKFKEAKAKLERMASRFTREANFMSIEGICAMACKNSHGTEYNPLWNDCLLEAYTQIQEERSLLMTYAHHFKLDDVATYGALLNGRMEFIENHLETHRSQNPQEQNKNAKK